MAARPAAAAGVSPGLVTLVSAALIVGAFAPKFLIITLVAMGLAGLMGFLALLYRRDVSAVMVPLVVMYAYYLGSGLAVGGLQMRDLLNIRFFDGDGRIFIAYLPMFFFCLVRSEPRHLKLLLKGYVGLAVVSMLLIPMWFGGLGGDLLGDQRFLMFQTHHTGAGTLLSIITVLLLVYGLETRNRAYVAMAVLLLVPILLTTSRQSLIGIAGALALLVATRYRKMLPLLGLVFVAAMVALPIASPTAFERITQVVSLETMQEIARQWTLHSDWKPEFGLYGELVDDEKWNILARIMFFMRAINLFIDSPIFGAGFGRFNDYFVHFEGIRGILYMGTGGISVFTDKSAHNSYLHILSETGLVGLAMLGWLWLAVLRRVRRTEEALRRRGEAEIAAICLGIRYSIVPLLFGGMFGHAFATPSFGLPLVVSAGLAFSMRIDGDGGPAGTDRGAG